MIHFPKPLKPGDLIAVTAPSSGVPTPLQARLDLVLEYLRSQGYRILEGQCLRNEYKDASAPKADRARELIEFLQNPDVAAIIPPWGGELATELLDFIPFAALREIPPKWVLGFSDISTLLVPLTLIAGWATAHGPNLMDMAPTQTDPLTTSVLDVLAADLQTPVVQHSSQRYQKQFIDFAEQADAPLNLTEPTCWRRLNETKAVTFQGRLIGGCLDTIALLAGTQYGNIPDFTQQSGEPGTILYLENAETSPPALVRTLLFLKRHGWFEGLSGLLFGRSAGPNPTDSHALGYDEALQACLGELKFPILLDVDIGHQPPQFTLMNGAMAEVKFWDGKGMISQYEGQ
ncbi:MAG: S66 peptidase family protein [Leptolyngbyaceae cyanobacterium]